MNGKTSRIGLMGGTFDPIHYGHLFAAQEARRIMALDLVLFVPTGTPPHKRYTGMASADERYEMALLATVDTTSFSVSRIETERSGNSYTVDTLRALHALHPSSDFFLITGTDTARDIVNWKEPLEIASLCRVVTVGRPGYGHDTMDTLPESIRKVIDRIDSVMLDISATDIRARARRGHNIDFLLPPAVCRYIFKNNLYQDSDGEPR